MNLSDHRSSMRVAAIYDIHGNLPVLEAVLRLIADDAVYMPPGIAPLNGRKDMEALAKAHPWEHLAETPTEIDGRGDLAFVRGEWSGSKLPGRPPS